MGCWTLISRSMRKANLKPSLRRYVMRLVYISIGKDGRNQTQTQGDALTLSFSIAVHGRET